MHSARSFLAGWLIDGTGTPARRHVLMQVENGRIVSLKSAKRSGFETGCDRELTDLSHCTLLPGLVDCHVHLTLSGTDDRVIRQKQLLYTFDEIKPLMDERMEKYLRHGILAIRDGGDAAGRTLRYKNEWLSRRECPVILKAAGRAWRARGRYGRLIGSPPEEGCTLAQSIEKQEGHPDHVKLINAGLNSLTEFGKQTAPQFGWEELDGAVKAARRRGRKTMVHTNGVLPVQLAVDARCDSVEHGFFMGRENLQRMADLKVFWVPTAFSMKAFASVMPPESPEAEGARRNLDHQLEQIAAARDLGIPVAVGTDAGGFGLFHGKALGEELKLLMEAGYPVEEAIRCATLEGARLLGIEHELGQLARGMPATFIAVEGPPSSLPETLGRVEKVVVKGTTVRELP